MATTRAWTVAKSTGEKISAAEANNLNDLPMARGGNNPLLDGLAIDLGDFDLSVLNSTAGAGRFDVDADYLQLSGTAYPTFASARTVSNVFPSCLIGTDDAATWEQGGTYWEMVSIGVTRRLYFQLQLPVGITVSSLSLRLLNPNTSGSLPAAMPYVQFLRRAYDAASPTGTLADATDSSASVAAYNAIHALTISSIAHTVEAGYEYFMLLIGESGAGSTAGLRCYRPSMVATVPTVRAL